MVEISRFDEVGWKTGPRETMFAKQMQSQEGPQQYYDGFYYSLQNNGDGTWTWRVYDATQVSLMQEGTVQADAHEWQIPNASARDWIDVQNEGDIGEPDYPDLPEPDPAPEEPEEPEEAEEPEEEGEPMGEFVWIGALAMVALFVIFIGKGSQDAS